MGKQVIKYIDVATGEYRTEIKKTSEPFTYGGYLYRKSANHFRCFTLGAKEAKRLFDGLTEKHLCSFFMSLYMLGEGNFLSVIGKYGKKQKATTDEVIEYVGYSKRYGVPWLKALEDHGIIKIVKGENRKKHVSINPVIAFYNYRLTLECYDIWKDELEGLIPRLGYT